MKSLIHKSYSLAHQCKPNVCPYNYKLTLDRDNHSQVDLNNLKHLECRGCDVNDDIVKLNKSKFVIAACIVIIQIGNLIVVENIKRYIN
jgi:hypothetical protein